MTRPLLHFTLSPRPDAVLVEVHTSHGDAVDRINLTTMDLAEAKDWLRLNGYDVASEWGEHDSGSYIADGYRWHCHPRPPLGVSPFTPGVPEDSGDELLAVMLPRLICERATQLDRPPISANAEMVLRRAMVEALGVGPPLTAGEHRAMFLSGELANQIGQCIAENRLNREVGGQDWGEMAHELHDVQARIMAQAAARCYPDQYRSWGRTVPKPD